MNKFKLLSNSLEQQPQRKGDSSHDQKQHRREQIHLLNILDKCTQILRDDRIWIRNRVKQMDPDILNIFRKSKRTSHGTRMNESELHQLQVNLRKHVNRVKEKHKQEQLVRFKENLCSTNCLCEKNHRPTTISSKTNHTERMWQDDPHQRSEDAYRHSYDPYYQQSNSMEQAEQDRFKNKKKNLFDALKLNEPIEEESEKDTEKMSSYRSRSEEPQNRINYHFEEGYREQKRGPAHKNDYHHNNSDQKNQSSQGDGSPERHETWLHNSSNGKADGYTPSKIEQPSRSNNWSMYNVHSKEPANEHSVHFDNSKNVTYEYDRNDSDRKDERASHSKREHTNALSGSSVLGSVLSGLYAAPSSVLPKEQKKETGYSSSVYHPQPIPSYEHQHLTTYENNYVYSSSSAALQSTSTVYSSQKLLDLPKLPQYKPFQFSNLTSSVLPSAASVLSGSKSSYSIGSSSVPIKPTSDSDNLFTSPELLMECRKILQQSGEKKTSSILDSNFTAMAPLNFSTGSSLIGGAALSTASGIGLGGLSSLPNYQTTTSMNSSTFTSSYTGLHTSSAIPSLTSYAYKPVSSDTAHLQKNGSCTSPFKVESSVPPSNEPRESFGVLPQRSNLNAEGKGFGKLLEGVAAKDCFSEVKEIVPRPKVPEERVNPLANLMIVDSFEKESPAASRPSISAASPTKPAAGTFYDLNELSPEEVFDIFFFNEERERSNKNLPSGSMTLEQFGRIASSLFRDMDKFEKIFEFCDKEDKGHVNCLDFGKALEKLMTTSPKATPNPIREIFSLIDIKQKGFFTLEDYHRFLEQVLESEQDNYESVARIAYSLFEMADLNDSKQVEYWGLYITKETNEFQTFSEYLEQFEFEVEI